MSQTNLSAMLESALYLLGNCARSARSLHAVAIGLLFCVFTTTLQADSYTSENFVVTASSLSVAKQMANIAEHHRSDIARQWLGEPLKTWDEPCQVIVEEQPGGVKGLCTYETYRGRVENLKIVVKGNLNKIAEFVLPHEVAHAVLAVAVGHPLPRWADEGFALLSESESQQARQRQRASKLLASQRMMPLSEVLHLADYPQDYERLVDFYASSFSLTDYLVARGGKQRLLKFVNDGEWLGWEESAQRYYSSGMRELETSWLASLPDHESDSPQELFAISTRKVPADSSP